MKLNRKKKEKKEINEVDQDIEETKDNEEEKESIEPKKKKKLFARKKKKSDQVVRIEELEKILAESGDEIDTEAIVSMYMPRRRMKNFGQALLQLNRMYLWLMGMILLVVILFIVAFMQEKTGNFTINLNRLELFRKGVSIDASGDFENATARLTAETVKDATNISIDDLPDNLADVDGQHNGRNYMAYTYYVRNAGKEDLGYIAKVTLDSTSKGVEEAIRVAIWNNGERIVYAEPSKDGGKEIGCENFKSHTVVCKFEEPDFKVGYVNKYTIVIWLEGDDPECVDKIVGGAVELSMTIDADYEDETSLFVKYIQDIKETLFGGKVISAAGNEAPDYTNDKEITWKNRRNK